MAFRSPLCRHVEDLCKNYILDGNVPRALPLMYYALDQLLMIATELELDSQLTSMPECWSGNYVEMFQNTVREVNQTVYRLKAVHDGMPADEPFLDDELNEDIEDPYYDPSPLDVLNPAFQARYGVKSEMKRVGARRMMGHIIETLRYIEEHHVGTIQIIQEIHSHEQEGFWHERRVSDIAESCRTERARILGKASNFVKGEMHRFALSHGTKADRLSKPQRIEAMHLCQNRLLEQVVGMNPDYADIYNCIDEGSYLQEDRLYEFVFMRSDWKSLLRAGILYNFLHTEIEDLQQEADKQTNPFCPDYEPRSARIGKAIRRLCEYEVDGKRLIRQKSDWSYVARGLKDKTDITSYGEFDRDYGKYINYMKPSLNSLTVPLRELSEQGKYPHWQKPSGMSTKEFDRLNAVVYTFFYLVGE